MTHPSDEDAVALSGALDAAGPESSTNGDSTSEGLPPMTITALRSLTPETSAAPATRPTKSRPGNSRPNLTAVPNRPYPASQRTEPVDPNPTPRGFALYVGVDNADPAELARIAQALRVALEAEAPGAQSYASVALAPESARGRSVDLVRLALQEPHAVAEARANRQREAREEARQRHAAKVLIDTSRKRVTVLEENADLTYKEFELLQALVLREGRTVSREELVTVLWADTNDEQPNERTIDVHVRRLRKKLGDYSDIVRTVRGGGYRFDRHADVRVIHRPGPSPDRF